MNSEEVGNEGRECVAKAFALEMQKDKKVSILTNQFIRSGTDIGANIWQAFYAHGRADFIGKLQIALEKGSGSEYWLELLIESGYYHDVFIWNQCLEIKKILIS